MLFFLWRWHLTITPSETSVKPIGIAQVRGNSSIPLNFFGVDSKSMLLVYSPTWLESTATLIITQTCRTCRCINQSILACLFCCFGQQSSVGARYRPLQALNWTNRSEWLLVLLVLSWRLANNLLMVHCRHHPIWSASSNVAQQQPTSIQDIHPFSNPLYTLKDRGGCWSISQLSSSFYFVSKNGQKKPLPWIYLCKIDL